ncbi:MAG: rod shape-determining protein [Lachnospiraceae bacterium]|nr:rod shape-determining protein [Lachnospiraceae bacterium]
MNYPESLVFGLDIGTRSIVGTVGYKQGDQFHVVAQRAKEHETRAMLDGQIHDIAKVGDTIRYVKEELEEAIGQKLSDVCIAAAGRVLRTVQVHVEEEFSSERSVTEEDIFSLNTQGIEAAYNEFNENADESISEMNFYCVGYSVVRYYLNGYQMGNLEGHNARKIGCDLIATFLPDDVVDGLYKAVAIADLNVANITLEPIAAISLAIPEMYRMLNIALVDVGAGTSDISITKDGTIVAFGMIPKAGDAITEAVCQHCLVDFNTADQIKKDAETSDTVVYKDIIGLEQTIKTEDLIKATTPIVNEMAHMVADKIRELNGDKSVSAVFVVGGGGRMKGYTEALASCLELVPERVAIRGREVMNKIVFEHEDLTVDSLLVTPIGICLSYYEQSNNFIYVSFNGRSVKLYDNGKSTVIDAAMQAQFANEDLFPKRGTPLHYSVNGVARMQRGEPGESAQIFVNGAPADIHTEIKDKDQIKVHESTAGNPAHLEIGQIPEYGSTMDIIVNGQTISLPKFASVNGVLQSEYYQIQSGDDIHMVDFYTVSQVIEFMDVVLNPQMNVYVNNKKADMDTPIYANFDVVWTLEELKLDDYEEGSEYAKLPEGDEDEEYKRPEESASYDAAYADRHEGNEKVEGYEEEDAEAGEAEEDVSSAADKGKQVSKGGKSLADAGIPHDITVEVNGEEVILSGKADYVFVDVFEFIDFDLSTPKGSAVVTRLNGKDAQYMEKIDEGDVIDIHWEK